MGRSPPKNPNACAFVRARPSCPLVVRGHTRYGHPPHRGTYRPIELRRVDPSARSRSDAEETRVRPFVLDLRTRQSGSPLATHFRIGFSIASDEYVRVYNFSTRTAAWFPDFSSIRNSVVSSSLTRRLSLNNFVFPSIP